MLNDVSIDFNEYGDCKLNDIEKKQMKKRIKSKIRTQHKSKRGKIIAASIIALTVIYVGFNNMDVLANVPIIGSVIEEYINSNNKSLKDYKTVVGQTIVDNGVSVKLNEVLIDDDEILISSTFRSDEIDWDKIITPFPKIYINGKYAGGNGSGMSNKIDEATRSFFSRIDIKNIKLQDNLNIKVVYHNIDFIKSSNSYDTLKGKWSFEFKANKDKLLAEVKIIPINRSFKLENGQEIKIADLRITPASARINYKMLNGTKYDVHFMVHDQNGDELKPNSAHTLIEDSYVRFDTLDENITKLKVTPYVISGEEGEKKTDYHKVLENEAFEINIK